eukprot:2547960-Rhodomonas_salina.4
MVPGAVLGLRRAFLAAIAPGSTIRLVSTGQCIALMNACVSEAMSVLGSANVGTEQRISRS